MPGPDGPIRPAAAKPRWEPVHQKRQHHRLAPALAACTGCSCPIHASASRQPHRPRGTNPSIGAAPMRMAGAVLSQQKRTETQVRLAVTSTDHAAVRRRTAPRVAGARICLTGNELRRP